MKKRTVSFSPPDITEAEIAEVAEAMRSGWITTGPRTKQLERYIADFCHTPKAVCLNSATAALELTLRVLGIGEGDEVITSAYTYTASASVVQHVGARLVLVDTASDSYEMDYDALRDAITSRTKAIIPVDLGGIPCDYQRIFSIVNEKTAIFHPKNTIQEKIGHVVVVADAAHAFGAMRQNKMVGEIADFTSFSFHAVKNFTTAEGGAVVWREDLQLDDEEIYRQYQLLSLHGQSKDALAKTQLGAWEYDIEGTYYKCNMTDIMAAIGLVQMQRYPDLLKRRRQLLESYASGLKGEPIEIAEHYGTQYASSGHLCLVRLLNADIEQRNQCIVRMAERGIATNVHYKPLPLHTAYKKLGFSIEDYPNAYHMFQNEITLPLHTRLTDEDVDYVVQNFHEVLKELAI